jgi:hypothetical protein
LALLPLIAFSRAVRNSTWFINSGIFALPLCLYGELAAAPRLAEIEYCIQFCGSQDSGCARLFSPMQQNLGAANVAGTPLKKAAIAWTVDHCAIALGRRHDHTI